MVDVINSTQEREHNFATEVKTAEDKAAQRGVEIKDGRLTFVVEKWGDNPPDNQNTLSGIATLASQQLGRPVGWQEIAEFNGISDPDYTIHPGQIILGPNPTVTDRALTELKSSSYQMQEMLLQKSMTATPGQISDTTLE